MSLERLYRSRIRLQHLRLLVAIGQERNLRKAAELLHLSEPAASKCLKMIEGLFGVALFTRDAHGMTPTIYLEPIVRIARSIIGGIEEAGEEIDGLRNGVRGRVAVGFVSHAVRGLAAATVEGLAETAPDISFCVDVAAPETLLQQLAANDIEVAVTSLTRNVDLSQYDITLIGRDEYYMVAAVGHPLTAQSTCTLEDTLGHPWVLPPRVNDFREQFEIALAVAHVPRPTAIVESYSLMASLAIIERGKHISLVPGEVARDWAKRGRVDILWPAFDLPTVEIAMLTCKTRPLSIAAKVVVKIMQEEARSIWPDVVHVKLSPEAGKRGTLRRNASARANAANANATPPVAPLRYVASGKD